MLSQTAEYALRMVTSLAEADGAPLTSDALAQRTKVPADYTVKVLQQLARAGLVRAQRGRKGGYTLAVDPRSATLLDVVNAIDPVQRITRCPLDRKEHQTKLCPLHRRLDAVMAMLERSLGELSIADVLAGGRGSALCAPKAALRVSAPRQAQRARARVPRSTR